MDNDYEDDGPNQYVFDGGSAFWEHNESWISGTVEEAWEHAQCYDEEDGFLEGWETR